jgi:hypothetical protein
MKVILSHYFSPFGQDSGIKKNDEYDLICKMPIDKRLDMCSISQVFKRHSSLSAAGDICNFAI